MGNYTVEFDQEKPVLLLLWNKEREDGIIFKRGSQQSALSRSENTGESVPLNDISDQRVRFQTN